MFNDLNVPITREKGYLEFLITTVHAATRTAVMRSQGGRSNPHRPLISNNAYPQ